VKNGLFRIAAQCWIVQVYTCCIETPTLITLVASDPWVAAATMLLYKLLID